MEIENKTTISSNDCGNVCRVCLATNQNNQCIFDSKRSDSINESTIDLSEKLRLCSGVEVLENDGLPSTICAKCILKINDAHELRRQCQQSDIQLRELYGKVEKIYNINLCKTTKDKYSQTDYSFTSDLIKIEADSFSAMGYNPYPMVMLNSSTKDIKDHEVINESKYAEDKESTSNLNKQNAYIKCKQTEYERSVTGREVYRTRRMTMFKRVTSIENLKNHKERQRQYIKKNTAVKWDDDAADIKKTDSQCSYSCPKCTRCYSSKRSLDRHILTHDEKKFTCDKCNKHFFQLDKLIQHNKLHIVKEKPKPVLCKICNRNFRKTDTMVRHLNVHKRTNPKEVLSILKEIRDKRKLETITEPGKKEVENNKDKKETEEEFATNENNTLSVLKNRTLESKDKKCNSDSLSTELLISTENFDSFDHETLYRCNYCTKRYANEKSLQKHLQIHIEKRFVCNVCNMKFFRQDRLNSHKNRYGHNENSALEVQKPSDDKSAIKLINSWIREELDSDNEEKGFPCKICGKSYDTKKSLLKHQLSTHNTEGENCTTCGKMCACDEKEKNQHKSNERLKPYRCGECNKSFEKEVKLQKHIRIHERAKEQQDINFKRFLCHICSKTFRQNTGLMFHMRTHTGYKPHVCKYCGRGFTSNSNCINHERTHTGDRPFVCHFCSAAFAKSCTLKAHITTHTGEANYHCKTCGKSFRRLKYLKEHKFTHTGEKPYACKICGTAYSHSGSLFVHEKKCKAQYNSYQSNSTQNMQSYCESETSSPTSIITVLPQVYLNNTNAINTQSSKIYMDNIQKINSQNIANINAVNTSDLHIHSNSEISDVSLAVKSFALIGQMFQS
nr:zinc finger protein 665-like [Bombus vancouverensis nearcticus]